MNKYFLACLLILFAVVLNVQSAQNKPNALKNTPQNISVRMFTSGDFVGEFNFSGPLGSKIPGNAAETDSVCQFSSLFRKVMYRNKNSVEAWLTLECTFQGQKNTYKAHRIYLELKDTAQKIRLPMLDKNLKNVRLEFQYVTIK
ncbi:MAG: hypothetical protein AABY53_05080 [Bdellovibrionota bacterium]